MFSNTDASAGEQQPLVKSVGPAAMGKACFLAVVAALVCGWCVLDSWQHDASAQLFGFTHLSVTKDGGEVGAEISQPFHYPLTLAFFQFAFMGVLFLGIWYMLSHKPSADLAKVRENLFTPQWAGLVSTHVFSTFWLQSLMMPVQMMSPMVFAASRAVQVPAAAGFRSAILGTRNGGHPPLTTAMMFGAATLLIFSQYMIAECLCIWSGHGIQLAGVALVVIYLLLLVLPAANVVCMESVMGDLEANPLLMIAMMNILACVCGAPILAFAHFAGWEDVSMALAVSTGTKELSLLVIWLGVQMVLFSGVSVALIAITDSFWTVALTASFKAVFWWCGHLLRMYMSCPLTNVSVDHPHASLWGFIMLLGCILVGIAAVTDASAPKEPRAATKATPEKV